MTHGSDGGGGAFTPVAGWSAVPDGAFAGTPLGVPMFVSEDTPLGVVGIGDWSGAIVDDVPPVYAGAVDAGVAAVAGCAAVAGVAVVAGLAAAAGGAVTVSVAVPPLGTGAAAGAGRL